MLVACIVISFLWFEPDTLIEWGSSDPQTRRSIAQLLKIMSLSIIPWGITVPLQSYFATQGVVRTLDQS